ncbi:hypothetical protein E2C01_038771 [Portunus trituberculatus]|uniref:Uncharacterized protein n=1 Tax=Portunus trituberculatus TaxID=210409 RepID=A0A5B7FJF0_PORTR|nr:hypothetical protein [Portunus trituberculatus]
MVRKGLTRGRTRQTNSGTGSVMKQEQGGAQHGRKKAAARIGGARRATWRGGAGQHGWDWR